MHDNAAFPLWEGGFLVVGARSRPKNKMRDLTQKVRGQDPTGVSEIFEEAARAAQRGLWADPNPIPPWEWRRGARESSAYQPEQPMSPPSELMGILSFRSPEQEKVPSGWVQVSEQE